MKDRAPIQDSIDVRNFRNELKNSVVKRNRVHFIVDEKDKSIDEELGMTNDVKTAEAVQEEIAGSGTELDLSGIDSAVLAKADEIFKRLQREAAEDEAAKGAEWIAKLTAEQNGVSQELDESLYNASTGSYSGTYGKGEISDATKEQAANILGKKDDDFMKMILEQAENM